MDQCRFALVYVLSDNNNPDDFEIVGELDEAASALIKSMLAQRILLTNPQ